MFLILVCFKHTLKLIFCWALFTSLSENCLKSCGNGCKKDYGEQKIVSVIHQSLRCAVTCSQLHFLVCHLDVAIQLSRITFMFCHKWVFSASILTFLFFPLKQFVVLNWNKSTQKEWKGTNSINVQRSCLFFPGTVTRACLLNLTAWFTLKQWQPVAFWLFLVTWVERSRALQQ